MIQGRILTAYILVIATVAVTLFWGNTLLRQHEQFNRGEQAQVRGDFPGAVAGYESAIHMYTPGSPLVEKAAEKLWSLGERCERQGDTKRALIAYRSLRSSFYAVRGLTAPGTSWISRCDGKIAKLVGKNTNGT